MRNNLMRGFNISTDDWPDSVRGGGYDEDFYERPKATGFYEHPHKFNAYVRRRLPDKSLQHVKTWKNAVPNLDDLGEAFGSGVNEAIIDLEILFGRNSGKKKKGIRMTVRFMRMPDIEKKIHGNKTHF